MSDSKVCANCHRIYDAILDKCPECSDTSYFGIDEEEVPPDQKHDEGRPAVGRMTADFPRALLMLAELTSYGIREGKAAGEWKNIPNAKVRFEDALGRHNLEMHIHGRDQESMYLHAAHRAWNAMAVLELILIEKEKEDLENM